MEFISSRSWASMEDSPMPKRLQGAGDDDPVGQLPQIGDRPVGKHGPALPGRAGEHDHVDPVRLKGHAGGGAPVVVQHGAPLGEHGLLVVVLRHGPAAVELAEVVLDAPGGGRVEHQAFAEAPASTFLVRSSQVGPRPPGGDEDVRPGPGQLHRRPQPVRIVPHHRVVVYVDAQGAEALGNELRVGVGNIAEQKLGAHGDELRGMGHGDTLP